MSECNFNGTLYCYGLSQLSLLHEETKSSFHYKFVIAVHSNKTWFSFAVVCKYYVWS